MAFGIKRKELNRWKEKVKEGNEVVFLTHYWLHPRFPGIKTVTKAGCSDITKLEQWGKKYGLKPEWIHKREEFPHYDLIGDKQLDILLEEGILEQVERFSLQK